MRGPGRVGVRCGSWSSAVVGIARASARCCAATASRVCRGRARDAMSGRRPARCCTSTRSGCRSSTGPGTGRTVRSRDTQGETVVIGVIDDHTRLAYCELHSVENAINCAATLRRAAVWFVEQGCGPVQAVMTDNAKCYSERHAFAHALADLHARHILTPPYTPRWNGKIERFFLTAKREWSTAASGNPLPTAAAPCHRSCATTTADPLTAPPAAPTHHPRPPRPQAGHLGDRDRHRHGHGTSASPGGGPACGPHRSADRPTSAWSPRGARGGPGCGRWASVDGPTSAPRVSRADGGR
jgi:transposase InsO family protein